MNRKYYILLGLLFFLFPINLQAIDIVRNNNFFYNSIMSKTASTGGAFPDETLNNTIVFTNANIFNDLYKFNAIDVMYNNIRYSLLYDHINNIPETVTMWEDDGDEIPELGEINYNNLSYFNYDKISLLISKMITNNIRYSLRATNTNLYVNKAYGMGINIMYNNIIFNRVNYGIKLYDLLSFNKWDTGRLELNIPFGELHLDTKISKFIFGITILLNDIQLDYKFGGKFNLSDSFTIYAGKNSLYNITSGFTVKNSMFGFSYAYMIPSSDYPFSPSQQFSILLNIDPITKKRIPLRP